MLITSKPSRCASRALMAKAKGVKAVRPNVDEVTLPSGKKFYLVAKGRIANLVAAEGHPPEVMQMSFANQMMAAIRIHSDHGKMERKVYGVPSELEDEVARAALKSMGISIGKQTTEQKAYAKSWNI